MPGVRKQHPTLASSQRTQLPFCRPYAKDYFLHIALDALAQVKRGLRGLFSRRKKKKQPPKPEPTPSSDTPAAPFSPVEAPTTSKRSVSEAEDAPEPGALFVQGVCSGHQQLTLARRTRRSTTAPGSRPYNHNSHLLDA